MILTQAETALENIFTGDKLLTLLVRDLRHTSENTRKMASSGAVSNSIEADEKCLKITPIKDYGLTN